ncbi:hypothetical protein [Paenibacillus segetis]|uniref:Uncharacterized protein n=1 Tax=Paenibacillus segetis TaxID=1325360 RepID=A0ABQ1YST3_9BACL|nr:hypothetical protein [Paenibacillus segetis]GGH35185.1 hypothetical protein GCM10008013_41350 [Paenibacillus segetis]
MKQIWEDQRLIQVSGTNQVLNALKEYQIHPDIELDGTMNLTTAVREDEGKRITYYAVYWL